MENLRRAAAKNIWLFLLCSIAIAAPAQEKKVESLDPKAVEVIRAMSGFFQGLKSFRVDMHTTVRTQLEGAPKKRTAKYPIAMQRPNKFAILVGRDMKGVTVVCDGVHLCQYWPALESYTLQDAPERMDLIVASGERAAYGMEELRTAFLRSLTSRDPYIDLMRTVTKVAYVGSEDIDGATCHHLRFSGKVTDWDLWVEANSRPLPRKFVPDYQKLSGQFAKESGEDAAEEMQSAISEKVTFEDWKINIDLPGDLFAFTPPAKARKVFAFFQDVLEEDESDYALLGRAAPTFKLELLGGGQVDLTRHKGVDVVVLAFWSRWFPQSELTLVILAGLAASYANEAVAFYGVNQGDAQGEIREFVDGMRKDIAIALDQDEEIGELYDVFTPPQVVLIGKDGTVQRLLLGWRTNLKELLKKDLDALLGK